jgi:hypothetical protein
VRGTVSLVSVRPAAKSDIVFVLENALRLSVVVLVRDTACYRLTPLGEAVGAGAGRCGGLQPEPGYGVSGVPSQHASAKTLLKLMDSFATKPAWFAPTRPETRSSFKAAALNDARRWTPHSVPVGCVHRINIAPMQKGTKTLYSVARVAGHDLRAH